VKRGFASPLCPWYLRDYGGQDSASILRCPFGGGWLV
jgi:hypothetical protein